MAGKSWTATTSEGVIIPANKWRNSLLIQCHVDNDDAVFIQIGQSAETDKGIKLTKGKSYRISGWTCQLEVHGVTKSSNVTGGYEQS